MNFCLLKDSIGVSAVNKQLKGLSLVDPRSPSGIPRTPIVVDQEEEDGDKTPSAAEKKPVSKLTFDEDVQEDEEALKENKNSCTIAPQAEDKALIIETAEDEAAKEAPVKRNALVEKNETLLI